MTLGENEAEGSIGDGDIVYLGTDFNQTFSHIKKKKKMPRSIMQRECFGVRQILDPIPTLLPTLCDPGHIT